MFKSLLIFLFATLQLCAASALRFQEKYVKVKDAELYCRSMGEGEPLIVVHGGPGLSQEYLLPHLEKLAKNNFVIFYDQRGCGKSKGIVTPETITMKKFIKDLKKVREAYQLDKVSLLGHNWGGLLALQYALKHPTTVNKLILLNSHPDTSSDREVFLKEWVKRMTPYIKEFIHIEQTREFAEGNPETYQKYFNLVFRTYFANPQLVDKLSFLESSKANLDGRKTAKILRDNFLSHPFDLNKAVHKLKCPTLIIHGDKDPIPLKAAYHLKGSIPRSTLVVLKDCGHFPYIEKPDELFPLLTSFLNQSE